MKRLTCEMCGSTDIMKEEGVFVCQSCGCKYSAEEAKKMMIEGIVDVSGSTVKVDNSERLNNLYQIARRARTDNNYENAAKYYDMILVEDPTSWEAAFYLVYSKAMECNMAQIRSAGISVSNCIDTVLKLIKDHVEGESEQDKAVLEVHSSCKHISTMLNNASVNDFNKIDEQIRNQYADVLVERCSAATNIMYFLGNYIDEFFSDHEKLHVIAAEAWKQGIDRHSVLMPFLSDKESNKNIIMKYVSKVQKYDKSYQAPKIKSDSGCYIATCVYGSYDCPQVWTLRRYRDCTLSKTRFGRAFIRIYYTVSPVLVRWLGHTEWFKNMWKPLLDSMVNKLNRNGFASTPYDDTPW